VTNDLPTDLAAEDEIGKLKKAIKEWADKVPPDRWGQDLPIRIDAVVGGNPGVKEFKIKDDTR
jgi:hypothetical protein